MWLRPTIYQVGPGDELLVEVWEGATEGSFRQKVDNEGEYFLKWCGAHLRWWADVQRGEGEDQRHSGAFTQAFRHLRVVMQRYTQG